jgi:ATP-dependent Clp endopeptidase proteolytic subunit ClpP
MRSLLSAVIAGSAGVSAAFVGQPAQPVSAVSRVAASPVATITSKYDRNPYAWDAARGLYMMPQEPGKDDPEIDPRRKEPATKPSRPVGLPMVGSGDDKVDVISRLLRDRILLLGSGVDDEVANVLVAQFLYLANEDASSDITMYINSPGGSVSAGMAIFDSMQFIPCDTNTVCFGTAASMGAFLLGAGTKGKRRSLPNSRIMIHQPLGGAQGQAADIEIQAKEILFIRALLCEYIADYTGQPVEKVEDDCDRDFFMTPEEAKDYGIIDEVLASKVRIPNPARPELAVAI